jgi:hypothetical protein
MDEATLDHKRRLLAIYQDNLRELEAQAARYGANLPLITINEIKHHRKNIDDIRVQLTTNAEEVTFDKLLVNIEQLRQFRRTEILGFVLKSLQIQKKYHEQFGNTALFSFAGIGLASVLEWLYRLDSKNKGRDQKTTDITTAAIKGFGAIVTFAIILRAKQVQNKALIQEYQELLDSVPGDYFPSG